MAKILLSTIYCFTLSKFTKCALIWYKRWLYLLERRKKLEDKSSVNYEIMPSIQIFIYFCLKKVLLNNYFDDTTIIFLMKQLYCNNYCFRWQTIIRPMIFLFCSNNCFVVCLFLKSPPRKYLVWQPHPPPKHKIIY